MDRNLPWAQPSGIRTGLTFSLGCLSLLPLSVYFMFLVVAVVAIAIAVAAVVAAVVVAIVAAAVAFTVAVAALAFAVVAAVVVLRLFDMCSGCLCSSYAA